MLQISFIIQFQISLKISLLYVQFYSIYAAPTIPFTVPLITN